MAKYKVNVTEKNFGIVTVEADSPGEHDWRGVVRRWQNARLPVEGGGDMIRPFYVIRILQDGERRIR